ncbi:MAG: MotA/TolQ/ExbB proton channel family protein [Chromatiales bacterium]|nr:MotA/TolQ/ExbB proton channel family protein [Chromatiales bacterium]
MTDTTTIEAPAAPEAASATVSAPSGLESAGTAPVLEGASAVGVPAAPPSSTGADDWIGVLSTPFSGLLELGGPVLLVLGLLSMVALTIVLLKLWQFARLRLEDTRPVEESLRRWRAQDGRAALAVLAGRRQPVAEVVHLALSGVQRPKVDLAMLREELARVAGARLEHLRAHLRALEIIGMLSPLLGLLGTVLGMIEAFRQLESAGSQVDAAVLSGGIWQALLTTAVGLSVAIPVVLAHSWLERRVERCGQRMEDAVTQVFTRDLAAPVTRAERRASVQTAFEVGHAA